MPHPTSSTTAAPPPNKRTRTPNPRFVGDEWVTYTPIGPKSNDFLIKTMSSDASFFANLNWDSTTDDPQVQKFEKLLAKRQDLEYSEQIGWHPLAFQAKANDSPTLQEVLNMPPAERKLW